MKKLIAAAATLLAVTAVQAADQGFYVGADYSMYNGREGNLSIDFGALGVTAGYQVNDFFAAEVRASTGANDDTVNGVQVGLGSYIGAQAVAFLPINNQISLYGTVGIGSGEIEATNGNLTARALESDISYGGGIQVTTGQIDLRLGYENLLDKNGTTIDGVKFAGIYRF